MYNRVIERGSMIPYQQQPIEFADKLEIALEDALTKGEPVRMDKQIIYTEAKLGVIDDYDIRADKFDRAIAKISKTQQAIQTKMEEALKEEENAKESEE